MNQKEARVKTGNTDRHFKGQLETEVVECFFRKHWIVIMKDIVVFLLFLVVMGFAVYHNQAVINFFRQNSIFITGLPLLFIALFTVYIHRFSLKLFRYFLDIVIFTNYRIVVLDKSLYLRNTKEAIDLGLIQNIEKEQVGVIPNLLGYGNFVIMVAASSATKKIPFVPNADFHFRKLNRVKREHIKEKLKYTRRQRHDPAIKNNFEHDAVETFAGLS